MLRKAGLAAAALGLGTALQGCGSSSGTTTQKPEVTTTTLMTTTTPLTPIGPQGKQDFVPVRGVVYDPRPFKSLTDIPGRDMSQAGAEPAFHTARDDLGLLRTMGASSVRVWAGIGDETKSDHSKFLDRCQELGLNVIVDYATPPLCGSDGDAAFDCSDKMKTFTTNALQNQGFAKDGKWHPAVKMIILMQTPDGVSVAGETGTPATCPQDSAQQFLPWCRVKIVLSLFDGFLQGEAAAGIDGSEVKVGVAWDWTQHKSVDGKESAELYGFQDMVAAMADPSLGEYEFKFGSDKVQEAYSKRWVHAINTAQTQWKIIKEKVLDRYSKYTDQPLLLSQLSPDDTGMDPQDLVGDLQAIEAATKQYSWFMGAVVQGFQTDYEDTTALRVRMFGLGADKVGNDMEICKEDARTGSEECKQFSVWCLDPTKEGKHSDEVAKAWGGHVGPAVGLCKSQAEEEVDFVM